jgi:nucleotide-binding universal stress UspA family protein
MKMAQTLVCPGEWQRLLVCTDGSEESQGAVAQALALGRVCGSRVYVLQVLEIIPEFEAVAPELRGRLEEESQSQMEVIRAQAARMGVAVETRVRHGISVHSTILAEAEAIQPQLILMGRYGRTGLARLLMGSVTARVIGFSPVNVLVVPRGAHVSFGTLLVASDGSPCSAAAVNAALGMTQRAGSQLFAVCAAREEGELPEAQQIIRQLVETANREGVPLQGLVPSGQPPDDAIVQAAMRYRADLIILGSHGRTGMRRLLMGSVTERVIGQSPCPVLVVKEK